MQFDIVIWWSRVVGAAGTQRCVEANERPEQETYISNKIFFFILQTKPAQIQFS